MTYALDQKNYTGCNIAFWGVFHGHCKKAREGSLGHKVIHVLIASVETIPVISQIASLFEYIIVNCFLTPANPSPQQQPTASGEPTRGTALPEATLRPTLPQQRGSSARTETTKCRRRPKGFDATVRRLQQGDAIRVERQAGSSHNQISRGQSVTGVAGRLKSPSVQRCLAEINAGKRAVEVASVALSVLSFPTKPRKPQQAFIKSP